MRKIVLLLLFFYSSFAFAQRNVVDSIVYIRQLITNMKTEEALEKLAEINPHSLDNDTVKAVYLELKAQALSNAQRYTECIPVCDKAIDLLEQINLRQYEYLDALEIIATSYHRLKDYKNAEKFYRKAIIRSESAKVASTTDYIANIYLNLGDLYKQQGDTLLADESYQKASTYSKQKPIDINDWNYIDWENSMWDKIEAFTNQQKYQDAVDTYTEMIKGIVEKMGKGEKYIFATYSKAILLARYLNNYDAAQPLFEEVISLGEKDSANNESVCGAYCNLVLCYAVKGYFSNIDPIIKRGISYLSKAKNEHYPSHCIYRFVGNGAYWNKNYEMAIQYYEQYLSSKYKRENNKCYEDIVNQLSVSYIHSGQPNKAKALLEDFLRTDKIWLEKDDITGLSIIYHNLGRSYMLLGANKEALSFLHKSKTLQLQAYGEVSDLTLKYIRECEAQ